MHARECLESETILRRLSLPASMPLPTRGETQTFRLQVTGWPSLTLKPSHPRILLLLTATFKVFARLWLRVSRSMLSLVPGAIEITRGKCGPDKKLNLMQIKTPFARFAVEGAMCQEVRGGTMRGSMPRRTHLFLCLPRAIEEAKVIGRTSESLSARHGTDCSREMSAVAPNGGGWPVRHALLGNLNGRSRRLCCRW